MLRMISQSGSIYKITKVKQQDNEEIKIGIIETTVKQSWLIITLDNNKKI